MADIYLHGIETQEIAGTPNPVQTIDTGIIGLIGTAPDASDTLWPLNTIIPVYGSNGAVSGLGATGTLKDAIEGIFDQAGRVSQTILVVRVEEGSDIWESIDNVIGNESTMTGMYALLAAKSEHNMTPKLLIAPGFTSRRPTDGIKTIVKSTDGVGYTSAPTVAIAAPAAGGRQATAIATINSETGELDEIVITDYGRGYASAPTVTLSGGGATTQATATATVDTVANPVTMKLLTLAQRFRAGVIKDSTATTAAAAVADRLDYDSERLLIIEPMAKVFKDAEVVSEPASARVAGLQAYVDYTEGFWFSPSNHVVQGIIGVSRPIGHSISDPSAESQYLNKNGVAIIARAPSGGFKLWGSRVPSSGTMKFWSVRRGHDTIIDSIELAAEPYIDKPFGLQVLTDIAETVNSALRRWAALGATLGGRVWLDPRLNTKETWANGHLIIHYDAETPAPIEHITFMFSRNTGYYEVLAQNAVKEIERIAGTAIPA